MKLIAIAGGSGSGKTTLSRLIVKESPEDCLLISLDNYYVNEQEQIIKNGFCNFDHSLSMNKEMLLKNIEELNGCGETTIPQYCFKKRDRIGYLKVKKTSIIIVEGLYSIEFLKDIVATKIFIDVDSDVLLARRIKRDLVDRGRSLDGILDQYLTYVKPAYDNYIINQKQLADLSTKNNSQDPGSLLSELKEMRLVC